MTAQAPVRSPMMPPNDSGFPMRWFENMPAGNSFDQRSIGTDYNLQISSGIQSFQLWKQTLRDGYVAPPRDPPAAAHLPPWHPPAEPFTSMDGGEPLTVRDSKSTGSSARTFEPAARRARLTYRGCGILPPSGVLRMDWTR
jgi:hypothetical protein